MNTKQTQLRIESSLKERFRRACNAQNTTMTAEITRLMRQYSDDHDRVESNTSRHEESGGWMSRAYYRKLRK